MPQIINADRRESAGQALPDGIARVLIDAEKIRARVAELGRRVSKDYAAGGVTLIGILKGSFVFLADLMRSIAADCRVDFMSLSSYSGAGSTGAVRVIMDLREDVEGRDVLIVEDIVDTGLTLKYLEDALKARRPRSLEVCSLLDKPDCRKVAVRAKYVGFSIPNEFVVGYGLDFNERWRHLPYIGVLKN